jgi:tetratricopeptide (TPR) repeat protein
MRIHPPGTQMGQFEVVGYPVMGDVTIDYTCLDRERSCPTLLKSLRPELLSSRTVRNSYAQNGTAWAGLGAHPHIVQCHGVFEPRDSGEVHLVLQMVVPERDCDTAALTSWLLPGRPLPVLQALLFALQIARGLHYVATRIPGFIHGDLKPENVLVSGGRLSQAHVNRLRVTDLGLVAALGAEHIDVSKLLEREETAVTQLQWIDGVVGTPMYMAPELWRGKGASTASDIYALGCILYRMLVGRHPVGGDKTQYLRTTHCAGNVRPLPARLPESVHDLIARFLALGPGNRYQSWKEVETAIALGYEDTVKYPVPAAEPSQGPTASERIMEGWFLDSMGCACIEAGNVNTAAECLELALKVGCNESDQALEATATSNLGEVYRRKGDTQRAIEHHQKALAIVNETGDRSVEGSALCNLGIAYLQLGNPRQAIGYLEKALAAARKISHRQGEMAALVSLGSVYHQMGDLRRSIQYFEQVLEIARRTGESREESTALSNLGGAHLDLGDNRRAIEYLEQSLAIKSEIGDRYGQIACLNNLGSAYRNIGRAPRATKCHEEALGMAREMDDRRGEAFALNNMGSTHSSLGNMQLALEYHEQALAIFHEIGDRRGEGLCLTNLAHIYITRQDTQRAMEICEQALAIDREIGDIMGVAIDSFNMANLLVQQGRFSDALPCAEESVNVLEKVGHTERLPEARQLVTAIRSKLDPRMPKKETSSSAMSPDFGQQILRIRQDNPSLTANMTDEDIVTLLQQADYASTKERDGAVGPIATFVKRPGQPWKEREPAGRPDLGEHSVDEPVAHGDSVVEFPPEAQAQIRQFRADNSEISANMSDAEIAAHLIQSELTRFIDNLDNMSASECGALGEELLTSGLTREAEQFFRAQFEKSTHKAELDQQALALVSLGRISFKLGDIPQAMTLYRKGLVLAQQINNEQLVGRIYNSIGEIYRVQGKHVDATENYNKSLELCQKIGYEQGLAAVYGNLGIVSKNQGDFESSIRYYEKSLEYSQKLGDDRLTANQYTNLGVVYGIQGRYDLAVEVHSKSLEISQRCGLPSSAASAYGNLGAVYHAIGEYQKAMEMQENALAIMRRIGDEHGMSMTLSNLANLYLLKGDMRKALAYYEQAQTRMEAIGNLYGVAGVHFNRGLLFRQQGQITQARKELMKAQDLFGKLGEHQWLQKVERELRLL